MERTYDIILYGATSYTSKFIIPHLLNENINIALSSRDSTKIESFGLPVISCEIEDIDKITKNTKILLNCVGPYILTGESMFVRKMQEKYDEEAKRQNVYIVNCCGFDSIPADIGVEYLKSQFDSEVKIESTLIVTNPTCNKATWVSLIHSLSNFVKPSVASNSIRTSEYKREYLWDENLKAYKVIFRGIDHSVVKKTQDLLSICNEKKATYNAYIRIGNTLNLILYLFYFIIIRLLARCSLGRSLLINYYKVFSFGIVGDKPPKDSFSKSKFRMWFRGVCSENNLTKELIISGPDPAFHTTSICASQCAITLHEIISERERMSHLRTIPSGVVTPGFIFKNSNLINRLRSKGIKIEFV